MKIQLKNEAIFTLDHGLKQIQKIGEISGSFYVVKDFTKWGYDFTLVCDNDNVYLIYR